MARRQYKCARCDRTFAMAAHLGRHMSASHGKRKAKATTKKRKAKRRKGAKGTRRVKKTKRTRRIKKTRGAKTRKATAAGRPSGLVSRFGLRRLSLEDLGELVAAARTEARRRLARIREVMK